MIRSMIPMQIFRQRLCRQYPYHRRGSCGTDQTGSCGPGCEYPGSGCVQAYSRDRDLFCDTHCQRGSGLLMEWGHCTGGMIPSSTAKKNQGIFQERCQTTEGRLNIPMTGWGMGGCAWQRVSWKIEGIIKNEIGNSSGTRMQQNRLNNFQELDCFVTIV